MRTIPVWAALAAVLLAAPARAFWPFGESEEEQAAALATHVAESLREPNKTIALAQDATEAGDTEEAIRLFRKAQDAAQAQLPFLLGKDLLVSIVYIEQSFRNTMILHLHHCRIQSA